MTNQDKKEYLKKYIPAIAQLESMTTRRTNMSNIASQRITDMPVCHSHIGDRLAETICELVSMEDKFIDKELEEYQDIISNVLTAVYGLENMIEKQIMTLRYIHGMKWTEIYYKMGYEEKQTHRYHARALQNIEINIKKEPSL